MEGRTRCSFFRCGRCQTANWLLRKYRRWVSKTLPRCALKMLDGDVSTKPRRRIIIIPQQWAVLAVKWHSTMMISAGILRFLQAYSALVRRWKKAGGSGSRFLILFSCISLRRAALRVYRNGNHQPSAAAEMKRRVANCRVAYFTYLPEGPYQLIWGTLRPRCHP